MPDFLFVSYCSFLQLIIKLKRKIICKLKIKIWRGSILRTVGLIYSLKRFDTLPDLFIHVTGQVTTQEISKVVSAREVVSGTYTQRMQVLSF